MERPSKQQVLYGFAALAGVLLVAWATNLFGIVNKDPLADGPVVLDTEILSDRPMAVPYTIEKVVDGLVVPWSIVFASGDRWLVSEREGRVRVVENQQLQPEPLITFGEVSSTGEEGLMGLALDPDYLSNKFVYACYAATIDDGLTDRVVRFVDLGAKTSEPEVIIDSIDAAQFHAGCRLDFGPDGKLYITTGDATNKDIAQDVDSLGGKILRINPDGSVPDDNPFPNSPVWSLGHRNPQGLTWQPGTDQLFATEHGPSGNDGPQGGDELNNIQKGANYGWPIVSHEEKDERFISPLLVFTPAVAPSGATFYGSIVLPQFTDNLFFAALKGEGIIRVVFSDSDPSEVIQYEKMTDIDFGRIRDVAEGPDGAIYFMTSNRDGRGDIRDGDDAIYRIVSE